jgi:transcriptional regulator with GAF, ATPase, and Fis domain
MLDFKMVNLLSLSLIVKIAAEISFTEYIGVYDFSNLLGHLFKFTSFILLYKAVLEIGLMKPYHFLFLDLKKSQDEYRVAQEELQLRIEQNLSEAYEHLGVANRKISLLLEMEAHSYQKKNKDRIIEYIVNLAKNASRAKVALLYCAQGKNTFSLICEKEYHSENVCSLRSISTCQADFVRRLVKEKKRISCSCKSSEIGHLNQRDDLNYFVALPLVRQKMCRGFLFLGYEKRNYMETQELEFLDIFAIHAASALARLGVIEK